MMNHRFAFYDDDRLEDGKEVWVAKFIRVGDTDWYFQLSGEVHATKLDVPPVVASRYILQRSFLNAFPNAKWIGWVDA